MRHQSGQTRAARRCGKGSPETPRCPRRRLCPAPVRRDSRPARTRSRLVSSIVVEDSFHSTVRKADAVGMSHREHDKAIGISGHPELPELDVRGPRLQRPNGSSHRWMLWYHGYPRTDIQSDLGVRYLVASKDNVYVMRQK